MKNFSPSGTFPEVSFPKLSTQVGPAQKRRSSGRPFISGIAGDQQSALFGQACFQPGMAKCTYGTGCFILLNIGEKPMHSASRLLTTVAWSINGRLEYALGKCIHGWSHHTMAPRWSGHHSECIGSRNTSLRSRRYGGVVLVPAFTGLGHLTGIQMPEVY